mmetsp:Transcript_1547/g.4622  ORF Transcript_1547/g.4622 Transcript_1547/m.4622 type:complete len:106 (-) Transcript_1547:829-1146(-)
MGGGMGGPMGGGMSGPMGGGMGGPIAGGVSGPMAGGMGLGGAAMGGAAMGGTSGFGFMHAAPGAGGAGHGATSSRPTSIAHKPAEKPKEPDSFDFVASAMMSEMK